MGLLFSVNARPLRRILMWGRLGSGILLYSPTFRYSQRVYHRAVDVGNTVEELRQKWKEREMNESKSWTDGWMRNVSMCTPFGFDLGSGEWESAAQGLRGLTFIIHSVGSYNRGHNVLIPLLSRPLIVKACGYNSFWYKTANEISVKCAAQTVFAHSFRSIDVWESPESIDLWVFIINFRIRLRVLSLHVHWARSRNWRGVIHYLLFSCVNPDKILYIIVSGIGQCIFFWEFI